MVNRFIFIGNNGQEIAETNYWATEQAKKGLCLISTNAGAIRLLVPEATRGYLEEMKTGKCITIEESLHDSRCVDIIFEDGTDMPFFLAIDKQQIDRVLSPGKNLTFAVWTERGKEFQLKAEIKKINNNGRR